MTKLRKLPHGGYLCGLKCCECPLSYQHNGTSEKIPCRDFEIVYPLQAISIVQKWSNAHPPKTFLTEFLRHYPNAVVDVDGVPRGICPYELGLTKEHNCMQTCEQCWNHPIN